MRATSQGRYLQGLAQAGEWYYMQPTMYKLRTIGHFVLRAGSLQASSPALGVRGA